jgi:hypothetical protein
MQKIMSNFMLSAFVGMIHLGVVTQGFAQNTDNIPKVLIIGQDEKAFETLQLNYENQLLSVCNNDMDAAYTLWIDMLKEMETLDAALPNFDLNGINIWLYVFWEKDGSIAHLAYYLKPNSRFVREEELTAFFNSFVARYQLPLSANASSSFSHYSAAFFPTAALRMGKN